MSYPKDYVEGKLPVYRHSSQLSQEILHSLFQHEAVGQMN